MADRSVRDLVSTLAPDLKAPINDGVHFIQKAISKDKLAQKVLDALQNNDYYLFPVWLHATTICKKEKNMAHTLMTKACMVLPLLPIGAAEYRKFRTF